MNWKTKLVCTALCAAQLLCAIPSVCAAEAAAITPDMTMQQIRNDPVMRQSGLFLYGSFGEGTQWTRSRLEDQTLQEYAWGQAAEETAAALNLAAQNRHTRFVCRRLDIYGKSHFETGTKSLF